MKRVLNLLILVVPLLAKANLISVIAGPAETQFNEANKLYEQGKFAEAAGAYEKMILSGSVSSALCFNLGDACFKANQMGRAIVAYRQAAHWTPRDPDVRANLQFARNQVTGPRWRSPRWENWLGKLSLNEWTWLAVTAFWILFLLLAVGQWRPQWRRALKIYLFGASFLLVVFGAGFGVRLAAHHAQIAVVTAHDIAIRNGPFEESPNSFTAQDGAEFQILDAKDDWFQVSDGVGRIGWVKRDSVAVVPQA